MNVNELRRLRALFQDAITIAEANGSSRVTIASTLMGMAVAEFILLGFSHEQVIDVCRSSEPSIREGIPSA